MKAKTGWILAMMVGMLLGLPSTWCGTGDSAGSDLSAGATVQEQHFKLGLILTQIDPETVFNTFRVAQYALDQGDEVSIFLLGKGVDLDRIQDPKYNVREMAGAFQEAGGRILACGTCLQMHGSTGSKLCPVSTMKDLYEIIRGSDRLLTF